MHAVAPMTDRIQQLQALLAAEPNDTFCTYGLAMEHAKRGETAQAIEWFDRTLAIDPNYCYAYFHKARAQHAAGDSAGASATLQRGLKQAQASRDFKAANEIEALLDEWS